MHTYCLRYHIETRGQTNTPRMGYAVLTINGEGEKQTQIYNKKMLPSRDLQDFDSESTPRSPIVNSTVARLGCCLRENIQLFVYISEFTS